MRIVVDNVEHRCQSISFRCDQGIRQNSIATDPLQFGHFGKMPDIDRQLPLYKELETVASIGPANGKRNRQPAEDQAVLDRLLKELVSAMAHVFTKIARPMETGIHGLRVRVCHLQANIRRPVTTESPNEISGHTAARPDVSKASAMAENKEQAAFQLGQLQKESAGADLARHSSVQATATKAEVVRPSNTSAVQKMPGAVQLPQAIVQQAMPSVGMATAGAMQELKKQTKADQVTRTAPGGNVDPDAPGSSSDPQAVLEAFNRVRARENLPLVYLDSRLTAHAAANNEQSMQKGLGHHVPLVFGAASGEITMELNPLKDSATSITQHWLDSPPHRKILLDRHQAQVGIDTKDRFSTATFNRRHDG